MGRPNIVLFMSDQQRADSIGAFGNPVASTPHLDALARRGTTFTQAFGQHSACSQSRISMMTGWYPHVAGHRTLDHLLQPWEPNLLAILRANGYFVAWPGVRGDTFADGVTEASTDFFGYTTPPSLKVLAGEHSHRYEPGHRLEHSFYIGRSLPGDGPGPDEASVATAVDLIRHGLPEPFVLLVTLFAPHPPFAVDEPWFSMHDRRAMPRPIPAGVGKAGFVAEMSGRSRLDRLDDGDWAEIVATYYGMVSKVDHLFGQVQAALDAADLTDRTLTVFHSDHGEYLGDFGLVEKWPAGVDECLLRNPLIVAGPGVAEGAAHDGLVEMIDITATLWEVADVEPGHQHFGRSLVPVLADPTVTHRDRAFSEGGFRIDEAPLNERAGPGHYALKAGLQQERPDLVGRVAAVRTPEWTFVQRLYEPDELYDRRSDPRESTNVAAQHPDVCAALQREIADWFLATSDVIPMRRDQRMAPTILDQFLGSTVSTLPE